MSDIIKVPAAVALRSRMVRMAEKRPASELEALLELQALAVSMQMPPSMNRIAISLGWSRDKLRNAHARWADAAAHAGDLTACPPLPVRS